MKPTQPARLASLLLLTALYGCAAPQPVPQPAPQPSPQPSPRPSPQPAPQPTPQPAPQPAAPAKPAAAPIQPNPDVLDAAAVGRLLRDTPQSPGPALQARTQALLALGKARSPAEQLQLAMLLLARGDGHDVDRAQNLLESLRSGAADAAADHFVLLLLREAQQQRALAQAQQTAQTLKKQIDQIKSLETQLQNRAH